MEQALYYINLYDQQMDEKGAEDIDGASDTKEEIGNYLTYISTLKLMHDTNMLVTKSRTVEGEEKTELLHDALTLGDKSLQTAKVTQKPALIAQASALMATIQFKEVTEKDHEKEKLRLETA